MPRSRYIQLSVIAVLVIAAIALALLLFGSSDSKDGSASGPAETPKVVETADSYGDNSNGIDVPTNDLDEATTATACGLMMSLLTPTDPMEQNSQSILTAHSELLTLLPEGQVRSVVAAMAVEGELIFDPAATSTMLAWSQQNCIGPAAPPGPDPDTTVVPPPPDGVDVTDTVPLTPPDSYTGPVDESGTTSDGPGGNNGDGNQPGDSQDEVDTPPPPAPPPASEVFG